MLILNQSDSIKIQSSTNTSGDLYAYTSFRDATSTTFSLCNNIVTIASPLVPLLSTIVSGPDAGKSRGIDYMSLYYTGNQQITFTIILDLSGTQYKLTSATLQGYDAIEYTDLGGFTVRTNTGATVVDYNVSKPPMSPDLNTVVLSANVANSTTALSSMSGLLFPVKANRLYWFTFFIRFISAITTTGALFTIDGPAFNYLMYDSSISTSAGANLTNANLVAYNSGSVGTALADIARGGAIITGVVEPSADGYIIGRFRSEVAASAITAISGSFVRYREIYKYS